MDILIVDDERDIRDSLKDLFEDEGYVVSTAANGSEALEILKHGATPSVMILDLLMPVMGGVELFQTMQADPRLSRIPVIVSTSDPSDAPSGVLIMKKPIRLDRLMLAVEQHVTTGGSA
jgi:CheY-like chemotaxis protein